MNKFLVGADVTHFDHGTSSASAPTRRRPLVVAILSWRRYQLLLGLLFAVVFPALFRWPDTALRFEAHSLNNALIGTTIALLGGYFLVRRLTIFPGLQVFSFILPSFAISYGILLLLILLFTRAGLFALPSVRELRYCGCILSLCVPCRTSLSDDRGLPSSPAGISRN